MASLFKPIYGTEIDKWMRSMWVDVCATICYGDTDERKWVGGGCPIYVKSNTECKTFSTGRLQLGLDSPEGARYLKQVNAISLGSAKDRPRAGLGINTFLFGE